MSTCWTASSIRIHVRLKSQPTELRRDLERAVLYSSTLTPFVGVGENNLFVQSGLLMPNGDGEAH